LGTDGKLYGLLGQGNSAQPGWIYIVTTTGTFTILHEFCQESGCTDGIAPWTPLFQHTNGKPYGFTLHGGDESVCQGDGCGVFYVFDVGLGPFANLVTKSGREGAKIGILGQALSQPSVVKFGGTQATTVTRSGATFLMATVPAEALTGSVTVATGKTTLTSLQTFKVTPTLTSFTPPSGPVGTSVTITGTGLTQATKGDVRQGSRRLRRKLRHPNHRNRSHGSEGGQDRSYHQGGKRYQYNQFHGGLSAWALTQGSSVRAVFGQLQPSPRPSEEGGGTSCNLDAGCGLVLKITSCGRRRTCRAQTPQSRAGWPGCSCCGTGSIDLVSIVDPECRKLVDCSSSFGTFNRRQRVF
jgi:hypothetical protein